MDAARQDRWIIVENPLDAIAVVEVDIDIGNSIIFLAKDGARDGGIIEEAETGCAIFAAVVKTSTESKRNLRTVPHIFGGPNRASDEIETRLPHVRKGRIIATEESVTDEGRFSEIDFVFRRLSIGDEPVDFLEGIEKFLGVDFLCVFDGGDPGICGFNPVVAEETDAVLEALRPERMLRAEVIFEHAGMVVKVRPHLQSVYTG
jgi:hypothetical protein